MVRWNWGWWIEDFFLVFVDGFRIEGLRGWVASGRRIIGEVFWWI